MLKGMFMALEQCPPLLCELRNLGCLRTQGVGSAAILR